jgi:LysM domain
VGAYDGTVLHQIQELNPGLANPDLIQPGQKILLPRHATPRDKASGSTEPTMRNK